MRFRYPSGAGAEGDDHADADPSRRRTRRRFGESPEQRVHERLRCLRFDRPRRANRARGLGFGKARRLRTPGSPRLKKQHGRNYNPLGGRLHRRRFLLLRRLQSHLLRRDTAESSRLLRPFRQPELAEKIHLVIVEPVAGDDPILDRRDIAGAYPHGFAGRRNGLPRRAL